MNISSMGKLTLFKCDRVDMAFGYVGELTFRRNTFLGVRTLALRRSNSPSTYTSSIPISVKSHVPPFRIKRSSHLFPASFLFTRALEKENLGSYLLPMWKITTLCVLTNHLLSFFPYLPVYKRMGMSAATSIVSYL